MSSAASALTAVPALSDDIDLDPAGRTGGYPMGALLGALSTVLRDTLGRFESISGQVSENVLTRGESPDSELIVMLQDFDRLQQEFSALVDVISYCATVSDTAQPDGGHFTLGPEAIALIKLTDLKDRLHDRIRGGVAGLDSGQALNEQVF
jgi:hypothetical protein